MSLPVSPELFVKSDVARIARQLLGKVVVTVHQGVVTSGLIVETEAYSHRERGCHAYQNKMTERNKVMFLEGGHVYVYLCYGMHHMLNVVTNRAGVGDAVLIRALQPLEGIAVMMERMNATAADRITSGPGKLAKAMAIDRSHNGLRFGDSAIRLQEGETLRRSQIVATQRIGIDYAGADARLPWRFYWKDNDWVSKK